VSGTPKHRLVRLLVLCTGNSARSQMAEGLLRHLSSGAVEVVSAGVDPVGLNPLAVEAMAELGIDISRHHSKHVSSFLDKGFDIVITVCDHARELCPVFPGSPKYLHWNTADPAAAGGSHGGQLAAFRLARDCLYERVKRFLTEHSLIAEEQSEGEM